MKLSEIASKFGLEVKGDPTVDIQNVKPLESAESQDLSFVYAPNSFQLQKIIEIAKHSSAGALLTPAYKEALPHPQLIVSNPMAVAIELACLFSPKVKRQEGVHEKAHVDASAVLGKNISIGPYAVVSQDVTIGDDVTIHPHVVVYQGAVVGNNCTLHSGAVIREFSRLGNDCVIQSGAVIGGDGFGYFPDKQLGHRHLPHNGNVELADRVDVGANSTIDRGMFGSTVVGASAKIDNLVMIGHNCSIGERALLVAQVGISGSSKLGKNVVFAGKASCRNHVTIGDNVRVAGKAGIMSDVSEGEDVGGYPHMSAKQWLRRESLLRKLPGLFKDVRSLKASKEAKHKEENKRTAP